MRQSAESVEEQIQEQARRLARQMGLPSTPDVLVTDEAVMPAAAGFLAVVFGMALLIAIHYVTWGWWLLRMRPGDSEDDEKNESANLKYDEPRRH